MNEKHYDKEIEKAKELVKQAEEKKKNWKKINRKDLIEKRRFNIEILKKKQITIINKLKNQEEKLKQLLLEQEIDELNKVPKIQIERVNKYLNVLKLF